MSTATVKTSVAGNVSIANLKTYSGPMLAAIFNELTGESVKRFATRQAGIKRLTPVVEEAISRSEKRSAARSSNGNSGGHRHVFDMPVRKATRSFREGTKRAKLIQMLEKGATREEIKKAIPEWKKRDDLVYAHIWTIGRYLGFGIKENEATGVIKLIKGKPKKS